MTPSRYIITRGWTIKWKPGLTYCRLMAIYEYLIVLKTPALRRESGRGEESPSPLAGEGLGRGGALPRAGGGSKK